MVEKDPAWPEEMDASERVRHVAMTRTTPRNAGWIANEANVSRDTAAKYLDRLVDQGVLATTETDRGTGYKPDAVTQFLREVRELAETHTPEELTQELNEIGEEIDSWKAAYDVESLTELRQSIGHDDLDHDARQDRLAVAEEWEYNIETREAIQVALRLKDSLTSLNSTMSVPGPETTRPQES